MKDWLEQLAIESEVFEIRALSAKFGGSTTVLTVGDLAVLSGKLSFLTESFKDVTSQALSPAERTALVLTRCDDRDEDRRRAKDLDKSGTKLQGYALTFQAGLYQHIADPTTHSSVRVRISRFS